MKKPEWFSEFEEFKNAEEVTPPNGLSQKILMRIQEDLTLSPWKIFSKLALIHFASALVTLNFCPQFGFRLLGEGSGLARYFSSLGPYGCEMACGFFFLGASLLVAGVALRQEEIRALRSHRLVELGALTLLSFGFFIMLDTDMVLGLALAWIIGSFLGGIAALELGWALKWARR